MSATRSICTLKPSDIPTPPEAAIQIMRACSRQDVNQKELSDLAGSDPVLSAELLRVVNSPLYGLSREIKSIARAVNVLGHRALRNLVLCIAVRDALRTDAISGFDANLYWEDSLRRAVAAKLLGQLVGTDGEVCFTAGLLQDFGLLVLFYLNPGKSSHWDQIRGLDPIDRYEQEKEIFTTTHDEVSGLLGKVWELPDNFVQALAEHHQCSQSMSEAGSNILCAVLHCADWAAAVYSVNNKDAVITKCREVVTDMLATNSEQLDDFLAKIPDDALKAAEALGLRITPQEDFETILRKANLKLVEENLSYQELTWRLEKAIKERDKLADELKRELELAREIQRSLLPRLMPPDFPATGVNIPARELSGDFFDYFRLDDDRIYFNLADVSGKGMNAALLMAKTSSLFRCLGKQIEDPGKLVAQINDEICETTTHGMFVTMIAGLFHPASGELRVVNAGHLPALLFSATGKVARLTAQSPPLGILPNAEFPELRITLRSGNIYMYSDGVTESQTQDGRELGLKGLVNMIQEFASQPPRERLESMIKRLRGDKHTMRDDITLLLLQSPNRYNT